MRAGTAGDYLNVIYLVEYFPRLDAEGFLQHMPVTDTATQRIFDDCRLLVNFFEHEMSELTFFYFIDFTSDTGDLSINRFVSTEYSNAVAFDFSDIVFFQIDESVSHLA